MPPKNNKKPPKNKKKPPKNNKKPTDVYKVHEESFEGEPALIVCRSHPGRCPLLGLSNLLLLRHGGTALHTLKWTDGTRSVSPKKLQAFVFDLLAGELSERVKAGTMSVQERDEHMMEYQAQLDELLCKTGVFQHFRSINDFSSTREVSKDLFLPLGVTRRHALIPDPKDTLLYNAIKDGCVAVLIVEFMNYEAGCEKGEHYAKSYHDKMSVVKQFVIDGPEFTSYGLGRLREEAPEKELFLLHLNLDLHVVYKKDGELYLLATEEDMLVKYPDIMWLGLDENFDVENPLETERKLTKTFSPVNESWTSVLNQFLQELEEEKRRPEREIETAVSQEEAQTTCLQTKVDTDDSQVETVQYSCDSQKAVETKRSETVVERRFLRFVHRRVVSFKEFTSSYVMFKIYHFKGQEFSSTSHLGRLMAKGFLVVIFDVHKSVYSWNGDFKEEDMFVELELVDGFAIGAINCFITLTAYKDFKKEHGEADLETFVKILFPRYLCEGFQELPCYFQSFEADIGDMPDHDDPPEKFKKFHKYMSDHFFLKAPLARSTLVSSVYNLCDSEIVHADQSKPKPRYGPLDVEMPHELTKRIRQLSFSDPLKNVYIGSRVEAHITESSRWTCWDAIELGRHSKQHMMGKTQENGVQQIQDPVIIDLIIEQDLRGLLTQPIKMMIREDNFEGRFESTWEQFSGSEPKDDGARIPLLFGDEEVEVAEEPEAAAMQAAATVARTEVVAIQEPERFIVNDYNMKLTEKGLRSLEGENWVLDEVIDFVYCELSTELMSIKDCVLVLPNVAHSLTNLPGDSDPLQILDPGNNNMFLFPVNNREEHERADGGTHWSLVVLRVDRTRNECLFVHHDSIQNMNQGAADRLVGNLKNLFPTFYSTTMEGQTPQQANGYDCGVYVIALSLQIASWYKKVKNGQKAAEDWIEEVSKVSSEMVSKRRQELFANLKKKFPSPVSVDEEESNCQAGAVELISAIRGGS